MLIRNRMQSKIDISEHGTVMKPRFIDTKQMSVEEQHGVIQLTRKNKAAQLPDSNQQVIQNVATGDGTQHVNAQQTVPAHMNTSVVTDQEHSAISYENEKTHEVSMTVEPTPNEVIATAPTMEQQMQMEASNVTNRMPATEQTINSQQTLNQDGSTVLQQQSVPVTSEHLATELHSTIPSVAPTEMKPIETIPQHQVEAQRVPESEPIMYQPSENSVSSIHPVQPVNVMPTNQTFANEQQQHYTMNAQPSTLPSHQTYENVIMAQSNQQFTQQVCI